MRGKPFLKWAGGKTQLIDPIKDLILHKIGSHSFTYIEPFVGSGAVLFWVLDYFPNIDRAIINDINTDLTDSYISIKADVKNLIDILKSWEIEYHKFENLESQKQYYYKKRTLFNERCSTTTMQSALFIFLNRTCFNGLYRVNKSNQFNVPIGNYKKPQICNEKNLLLVSELLQKVDILNADYSDTLQYASKKTLFYLDPPYKPISTTSSFTAYSKDAFDDDEQVRLKDFCSLLDKKKHTWILSNSDVKTSHSENSFFDTLYSEFNITRVNVRRSISANSKQRGQLTELLIVN